MKDQVIDLSKSDLKVRTLTSTYPGPGSFAWATAGCAPDILEKDYEVGYCAQGSPLALYQVVRGGKPRPIASMSPVGFQDASVGPKPSCGSSNRGTLYVEKGGGTQADKPFLCVTKSDDSFSWMELAAAKP